MSKQLLLLLNMLVINRNDTGSVSYFETFPVSLQEYQMFKSFRVSA